MGCVIVCPQPAGGICHYSYCLAEGLARLGFHANVLTAAAPPYELAGLDHHHKIKRGIQRHRGGAARAVQPFLSLAAFLGCLPGSRAVHFQWPLGPRTDPLLWGAARRFGRRIVYTAHNITPHEAGNRSESHVDWLCTNADAVIVHGSSLARQLHESISLPCDRIHVLPLGNYNFVADSFDTWDRAGARDSFGWTESEQVVLFFGMIRRYKGLDTLIRSAGGLRKRRGTIGQNLRLLIVGEDLGGEWDAGRYEDTLHETGMAETTTVVRDYVPLAEIGRYFHAADVVALPYRSGSQSAVLQLAYAFGKPAVVTDVGSIGEAVIQGRTGVVVPPERPDSLAVALAELLADKKSSKTMGREGRTYAETVLSWDRIAAASAALYASRGPGARK